MNFSYGFQVMNTKNEEKTKALHIVVVEDYWILNEQLVLHLQDEGYEVKGVDCGAALDDILAHEHVDLLVLDLNLPSEDGYSIAQRMRLNFPHIGIIMLSVRNYSVDKAEGYRRGADIYLTKPACPEELSAAVERLAQRLVVEKPKNSEKNKDFEEESKKIVWKLNKYEWQLISPEGKTLDLSAREYELVSILIDAKGTTVSKQEIVKQLFGSITLSGQGRLDVLLTRLRKKCRTELGEEIPIQTAHSTGYNFGAPAKILES